MEVFSVFATLSLVDLISNPLGRVQGAMKSLGLDTSGLGARMGNLALAMAPVALAAGLVMGALGMASAKAMAFESSMADVAKVVNFETDAELKAMSGTIMDMAGRIPMAADGIAAIVAAAAQSGVAKQDLTEFAEQAAKMGVAFDLTGDQAGKMMADWRAGMNLTLPQVYALADAVNYLSNNMNATAPALGEVIQRVGAVAMTAGLAETQVAALGAAFLSSGAGPEVAATALKNFTTTLVKGSAMSKDQAAAFQSLGFSATRMAKDMQTDAQGTIFKVLQAIADKPKELQTSLLTEMFGQESLGAIAPLLQNMGNLSQAFGLVGDASQYAGSMQAEYDTRSKTTANALQLLSNKLTNLAISIGTVFLPAISAGANFLGSLADAVRMVVETPFGQWLVAVIGGISTLLVSLTALSAAMWFFSAVGPMIAKALLPLKAAVLGLGAPFWALIAVVGALYLAYKSNFGGIADTLNRWWANTKLVVQGVIAVFQSLKDGSGEIRGELATRIKAAGLVGLVTTVSRIVNRIRLVFKGMMDGISAAMHKVDVILVPVKIAVIDLMDAIGDLFGGMETDAVGKATSGWQAFGRVIGDIAGGVLIALTEGVAWLVDKVRGMVGVLSDWFGSASQVTGGLESLTGATGEAAAAADPTNWSLLGKAIGYTLGAIVAVKAALIACKGVMLVVSGISKAFAAAQWLVNAALAANPVVLITMAIIGLIAAIVYCIANWDAICAKWDEVWSYVGGVIGQVWDSITGKISSAWQGCVNWVGSIGQSLMGGMSSLWDSITQGATESWNAITSSVSAAGSGIMGGVESIWTGVTSFFSGLSLSESGAKLLDTFKEGIMSKVDAVKQCVSDALAKVRNLLPFSDAKEGPLSTLTLSGSRLMSTIGEGVGQGAPGLLSSVSGALGTVGKAIGDWWTGVRGNRMEMPGIATPDVVQGVLPQQAALSAVPRSALPQLSPIPDLRLRDVEIPETDLSGMDISYERRKSGGSGGNTTTNYITISNLTLPGVSDAKSFESDMQRWVGEYNGAMYGYSGV